MIVLELDAHAGIGSVNLLSFGVSFYTTNPPNTK